MNKTIVFDLDGTLCKLKPESEKYNHTGDEEKMPIYMYSLYLAFSRYPTVLLTWRKEQYRKITEKWLDDNDYHFDKIIMQKGNTAKKNHIFKREELSKMDVELLIDDNHDMVEVCRDLGIPLLLVCH